MYQYKTCIQCKQDKFYESFSKNKNTKDGLNSYCKQCVSDKKRIYYIKNAEQIKSKVAEYRKNNPDKKRELNKKWIEQNREKHLQYQREWAKNYRQKNPRGYKATTTKDAENLRNWRRANPEKSRQQKLRRRAKENQSLIYFVPDKHIKMLLRATCFYCGTSGKMTIDHVIPISRGGQHKIGNLVAACLSCNSSKCDKTIMEWRKRRGQYANFNDTV